MKESMKDFDGEVPLRLVSLSASSTGIPEFFLAVLDLVTRAALNPPIPVQV